MIGGDSLWGTATFQWSAIFRSFIIRRQPRRNGRPTPSVIERCPAVAAKGDKKSRATIGSTFFMPSVLWPTRRKERFYSLIQISAQMIHTLKAAAPLNTNRSWKALQLRTIRSPQSKAKRQLRHITRPDRSTISLQSHLTFVDIMMIRVLDIKALFRHSNVWVY